MTLEQQIEGVLFYKAAPIKITALAQLFSVEAGEVAVVGASLQARLAGGAVRLQMTDTEFQLVTAPELDELIESIRRDDLKRDISKAGAETLAIILYRSPITRAEIDRIRGVNSSFIIRNLLVRGLIERTADSRFPQFTISALLLNHLGITHKTDLPNYEIILNQLETFEAEQVTTE